MSNISLQTALSKSDGHRVLITKDFPKGTIKDDYDSWLKVLAPSKMLHDQYSAKKMMLEDYVYNYQLEQYASRTVKRVLTQILKKARSSQVTLICHSDEPSLACGNAILHRIETCLENDTCINGHKRDSGGKHIDRLEYACTHCKQDNRDIKTGSLRHSQLQLLMLGGNDLKESRLMFDDIVAKEAICMVTPQGASGIKLDQDNSGIKENSS